jgi:lauroyl/myristoyl acyltransferase
MAKNYLLPKKLINRVGWVQTPVWLLEAAAFYLLLGLARMLPFPVVAGMFRRLFGFLGYRNENKCRVVRRNLTPVMPQATEEERERTVRRVFGSTGLAAAELFLLGRLWRRRARYLEFSIHPKAQAILDRGEAIVFATAHAGAWQLTNLIGQQCGLSISVLYAREPNPWLHRFFLARRRAFGGPMVPFFGIPTPTSTLPAMLALRGYPLLPIRAVRLPGRRYRIEVSAPLAPSDPQAPRKAQILDLTTQLNCLFEGWIRDDPGQWICMKRRWPKVRPPAKAPDV